MAARTVGARRILVDADACPVKDEIYRVAWRRKVPVVIVSNARIRIPEHPLVTRQVVSDAFDAADDWIAGEAGVGAAPGAVVVTADILLADRCLKSGATVVSPTGREFTMKSIGAQIATRAIMADLRAGGDQIGGPAAFTKADRSRFLQTLDTVLARREAPPLRANRDGQPKRFPGEGRGTAATQPETGPRPSPGRRSRPA